ncbi:hypothetical protein BKA65DRAFT_570721 [Rhexocercosporidium sp. MPI-PUGE-AT-0058]|nr:hypothetical protein BKA65DRAFT_570721 [Rhexocercosporidium sp. MPI-PUGE-AT-0058]
MDAIHQPPAIRSTKELKSVGHAANDHHSNKAIVPYRQMGRFIHRCSKSEDAELESKTGQVPSLSADDSSRASSINHAGNSSEADDSGGWYFQGDEYMPFLLRTSSPLSVESHFHGYCASLPPCPELTSCKISHHFWHPSSRSELRGQQMPDISNLPPDTTKLGHEASSRSQHPKKVDSTKLLHSPLAISESSASIRQPTLKQEVSDSDSESDGDCSLGDIDNDEWSGADDNIEAVLYQAVYPDDELAAHIVSTMYPALLLSYRKSITRKVSSWQKHSITSCGISSGTASTTKEAAPQGTLETGRGSSSKRDRQSRSPDDNIEEEEDDDVDDSRRKRSREQPDSGLEISKIPKAKFACHFFKRDPVKYAITENRRACAGPGWSTIALLKEHLQRVHRPVQCPRCYCDFAFKSRERSAAVSERDIHLQQDEPCKRGLALLKEGISEAEWSRISEDRKKIRKGKGKEKAISINQAANPSAQWYEIWSILCPDLKRPSTPWYPPPHSHGPPHNQHFLEVSKYVNSFKLDAIKRAVQLGSNDDILKELNESDQRKFALYRSIFQGTSDATTDSFSNIGDNDLNSSGAWQEVMKDADAAQQLSPPLDGNHLRPAAHFTTHEDRVIPTHPSLAPEVSANGREFSISEHPNNAIPNATYTGDDNNQAQTRRLSRRTTTAPMFTSLRSVQAGMSMEETRQNGSQDTTFARSSTPNYDPNTNTDTNEFTSSNAYLNNSPDFNPGWMPNGFDIHDPANFTMPPPFEPLQDWSSQYIPHNPYPPRGPR